MLHLMEIESDFLSSTEVMSSVNFNEIFSLQSQVSNAKKSKFEKSLKLAKLVNQAMIWYSKAETKQQLTENGIEWQTTEIFINRVFGWQKSFGYKMVKAGKLQVDNQPIVTKFKRMCTTNERNGEDTKRTIEALLKFANAEKNGEDGEVTTREKTYAQFTIAKDGLNGTKGFNIRLTEDGAKVVGEIEDDNIAYNVSKLFSKLATILENTNK